LRTNVKSSGMSTNKGLVLVSGASGYVGSHVTKAFLEAGYAVRGTVRSLNNKEKIAHLQKMIDEGKPLELVEADLVKPESWECIKGCEFVAHTASPFFIGATDANAEEKLYKPAKKGTLNVLSKALDHGVKKVVLTSSAAAIMAGWPRSKEKKTHLDEPEKQWSKTESKLCDHYSRSKTIAEKAAWEFVKDAAAEGKDVFSLSTINPVLVTGPVLSKNWCQSADVAKSFVDGSIPMIPNFTMNVVDVRDVAKAHVAAIENPKAAGERFVVNDSSMNFRKWAACLATELKPLKYSIPTKPMPYFVAWTLSWFMTKLGYVVRGWGRVNSISNTKSKEVLGIEYIPAAKSVVDMAHSMIQVSYPGVPITAAYKEKYADAF